MPSTQVLIVGAGPTGLNLALRLARYGVAFRIIDRAGGPGEASRAMAVHARTLEFYRQLGLGDEIAAQGIPIEAMHLRQGGKNQTGKNQTGKDIAALSFKDIGQGLSPYPFVMSFPQDDHERFLVEKLQAASATVEWNTALARFSQDASGVHAVLSKDGAEEECEAEYICGCDGSHSTVREGLGLGFPGGTYPNRFYVVDAKIEGDFDTDGTMNVGTDVFALKLPVRSRGMQRLIGLVPADLAERTHLTFEDIRETAEHLLGVKVESVNWFSSYHSHHRVAEHFRLGRSFIAGDAGHVHSPAGGQGMNTGIGDAVNLAWKLAAVLRNEAAPALLDTYEIERIAFARKLVATTDQAFRIPTRGGTSGQVLRNVILPTVMPLLFRSERFRRMLFRTVSQTRITYRMSPLSQGKAGGLSGGDRLPWLAPPGPDNFAPLSSVAWQVHVYGRPKASLTDACDALKLASHAFPWTDSAKMAGFTRDAAYLVRPDGHIGLALQDQEADTLRSYVQRHGLRFAA